MKKNKEKTNWLGWMFLSLAFVFYCYLGYTEMHLREPYLFLGILGISSLAFPIVLIGLFRIFGQKAK